MYGRVTSLPISSSERLFFQVKNKLRVYYKCCTFIFELGVDAYCKSTFLISIKILLFILYPTWTVSWNKHCTSFWGLWTVFSACFLVKNVKNLFFALDDIFLISPPFGDRDPLCRLLLWNFEGTLWVKENDLVILELLFPITTEGGQSR